MCITLNLPGQAGIVGVASGTLKLMVTISWMSCMISPMAVLPWPVIVHTSASLKSYGGAKSGILIRRHLSKLSWKDLSSEETK